MIDVEFRKICQCEIRLRQTRDHNDEPRYGKPQIISTIAHHDRYKEFSWNFYIMVHLADMLGSKAWSPHDNGG